MPSHAYTTLKLKFSQNSVILFFLQKLQKVLNLPKTSQY